MPEEKTISTETIYQGKIISVRKDQVEFPDGRSGAREVVDLASAVAVVAVTDKQEVLLVKQYRYPTGRELLEIPAGKVEPGENPLDCAKRELEEETGYRAVYWRQIGAFFTSPGFCTEKIYLYFAGGLTPHNPKLDPDECIEVHLVPLRDAFQMVKNGDIHDAKTIIGLLTAEKMVNK
ncbi:NUDIX hydrolase [Desulfallas sp. Bu1-1]|uniref:NUDIX hydrolase n=1 Tax=Desulfallas sp. Bu1-1 TaxID=2787620 RepID=UPI00189CF459|nr:NUDIX hydrolase [Desulfallas sp. Bu1-1]MBF7083080.1 NUDIX hydrolase [Desulfallas sp. Bu1-1]